MSETSSHVGWRFQVPTDRGPLCGQTVKLSEMKQATNSLDMTTSVSVSWCLLIFGKLYFKSYILEII